MLSSLRNFLLALIISLIVCGLGAYFLVGYVQKVVAGDLVPTEPGETTNPGDAPPVNSGGNDNAGDFVWFTALIVGIDDGESQYDDTKKEADTIILININSKTKTIMISQLSCEMRVSAKGYAMRLGAVYTDYGIETLIDIIRVHTGLKTDYYCVFNYESIIKLFEIWGEIEYNVPMDMYYMPKMYDETSPEALDPERKPEIELESGIQKLDGEKVIQLLRFKGYAAGNAERVSIQTNFLHELLRQKITFENLPLAKDIFTAAKNSVTETNMDEKTFENYTELIFSLSMEYQIKEVEYPGNFRSEYGINFYMPTIPEALNRYKEYKKPIEIISGPTAAATTETIPENTSAD